MKSIDLAHIERILPDDQEVRYRQFHLKGDCTRAIIGFIFILIPLVFFGYTDYLLYSLTSRFFMLLTVRLAFLAISIAVIVILSRLRDYRLYDWLILGWTIIGIAVNFTIQYNRPPGFFQSFFIDMIIIIVFYLIIPCRLSFRILVSLLFTASEIFIIVVMRDPLTQLVANSTYMGYVMGNIAGIIMSIYLYRLRRQEFRSDEDNEVLRNKLELLATTDPLTGIQNSRRFFELAEKEIYESKRYQRPFTVAFMDLDHFKTINDTMGHQVGDEVLKAVCDLVKESIRETDTFARLGGEEFGILFPETVQDQAFIVCERIRKAIDGYTVKGQDGSTGHITISIGIAQATKHGDSMDQLLLEADRAVYRAKQKGRNLVELA
jgi:diguanylate cyclase (GGDEF)-like protein